ncbi:uncharacterized protein A1O9_01703 [Exophiala aquamarina CBS 119918]|uniref:Carboxylesterase type B domain-containing protein n=1 Tax=Exophiala aquamarina CBS 119918 TaxID=1182545 RepID=A0A072Q716_9EURO|nr:uncharacterized protein A1O9_01703 [Exophiala aquamarina CBS 119918]KEF63725.1 hypothetical protein A1O9_01703 [Exophiala aquamarina CBS 119918]
MPDPVVQLHHPQLGTVSGRQRDGTAQFLGLKYGVLKHRFAIPEINSATSSGIVDATKYGPPVIFLPESCDMEMSFIQQTLDKPIVPPPSDLEGLNLNITVPIFEVGLPHANTRLPVLVYVHGGGFTFGSSSYPHYDQARIVDMARQRGQPLIAVNINYRLGIPGFLTSKELRELGEGFGTNNGLRDHQTAFLWIKKYISGFGGNPDAITAIGQSAGAASLTYHLHSRQPLFEQCILLGGTFLMMRAGDFHVPDRVYKEIIRELGLDRLSAPDRVKSLLEMDASDFLYKVAPKMTLGPVVDEDIIPEVARFSNIGVEDLLPLPGRNWCHRLMTVDSAFDGTIMALVNLNAREQGIREAFQSFLKSSPKLKDSSTAQRILDFYGIQDNTSDQDALHAITSFVTDTMFYTPSVAMARAWQKSYVCHFNEGNPWKGLYQGRANHMLDIAYLWQNFNHTLTQPQQAVAKVFAEHVIGFAAGGEPVPSFQQAQQVTVYGPSSLDIYSLVCQLGDDNVTSRRKAIFRLADEVGGLDVLLDSALHFLMG